MQIVNSVADLTKIGEKVLSLDKKLPSEATELGIRLTRAPMVLFIGVDLMQLINDCTEAKSHNPRLNKCGSREDLYSKMMSNGEYSVVMPNGAVCLYMPSEKIVSAVDGLTRIRSGLKRCRAEGLAGMEFPILFVGKDGYELLSKYADSNRPRDIYIRSILKNAEGVRLTGKQAARLGKAVRYFLAITGERPDYCGRPLPSPRDLEMANRKFMEEFAYVFSRANILKSRENALRTAVGLGTMAQALAVNPRSRAMIQAINSLMGGDGTNIQQAKVLWKWAEGRSASGNDFMTALHHGISYAFHCYLTGKEVKNVKQDRDYFLEPQVA